MCLCSMLTGLLNFQMLFQYLFFGMQIKSFRVAGKIRVGRETGNTHIFFDLRVGHMQAF